MQHIEQSRPKFDAALAKAQAKDKLTEEERAEKARRAADRAANAQAGFVAEICGQTVLFLTKTFTTGAVGYHGTAKVMGPDKALYQVGIQLVKVGSGNGK